MNNRKIYLAGQDVFRSNAIAHFTKMKELCEKYGFIGMSPFDNELFNGEPFSKEHSFSIFKSNCKLIDDCDLIVANINPFRGCCIDDGTAFEIGYGYAKNKMMFGYSDFYNKKLYEQLECDIIKNSEFPNVEKFGNNCVNLMIQESIENSGGEICESFESCLKKLKEIMYISNIFTSIDYSFIKK